MVLISVVLISVDLISVALISGALISVALISVALISVALISVASISVAITYLNSLMKLVENKFYKWRFKCNSFGATIYENLFLKISLTKFSY